MKSFPSINAESGFVAALLIGFGLFFIGHEIAGSLFIFGAVAIKYITFLSL